MPGDEAMISVIIPVFNGEKTLHDCLAAVLASDYRRVEVIVVDDHSTDDSPVIARAFPCQVVRLERNAGAAAARNRGARAARGEVLFFLDADIVIQRATLTEIAATFRRRPEISALFCSYQKGTRPANFVSVYKNLLHHYTHQIADAEAATFCGGFGAIKREVFAAAGGFDERHRSLEDIELGYRLHRAGHRIYLHKAIQVTHCKEYTLASLVRSDVLNRAIPWTRLMLDHRIFRNDLNTRSNNILSVPISFLIGIGLSLLPFVPRSAPVVLALATSFITLNRHFFGFVLREKGVGFTVKAVLMSWLTYLYSGLGLVAGVVLFLRDRSRAPVASRRCP